MNESWNDILKDYDNCISEEKLRLYVEGKLSKEETRELELHLADCEICSDLVEGMQASGDLNHADEVITGLKSELKKGRKTKVIRMGWRSYLAIAASVAVVAIFSIFLINKFDNEEQVTEGTNEIIEEGADEESIWSDDLDVEGEMSDGILDEGTGGIDGLKNDAPVRKGVKPGIADQFASKREKVEDEEGQSAAASDENKQLAMDGSGVAGRKMQKKEAKVIEFEAVMEEEADMTVADAPVLESENAALEEKSANRQAKSAVAGGISLDAEEELDAAISAGNPERIKNASEELLKTDNKNRKALYYKAWSLFRLEDYGNAEKGFREIIALGPGTYFEDAQMMLAKSYLQQGKKADAKNVLREIVSGGGKYANEAKALLSE